MAKSAKQQQLNLGGLTPTLDQRFRILEDQLREMQREYKGEREETELRAARLKLKRLQKKDLQTQEESLDVMEEQVYNWTKHGDGIEVSQATMSDFQLKQSRMQDARRISTGLVTAAGAATAYSMIDTLSERNGDGIGERRLKKGMNILSRGIGLASTAIFLGPGAAAVAATGMAIQYTAQQFAAQAKIDRINRDTAYRVSLLGPASYSGSR